MNNEKIILLEKQLKQMKARGLQNTSEYDIIASQYFEQIVEVLNVQGD